MNNQNQKVNQGLGLLCSAVIFLSAATAQLISLKTVPVATGDQFLIFPSQNMGMGGVSIAQDDTLLDPFINPAKGFFVHESRIISSPSLYSFSNNDGTVHTLPLGLLQRKDNWFSGFVVAMQELEVMDPDVFQIGIRPGLNGARLLNNSANNIYAFGLLGTEIPELNLSIAGSMFWANLDALDGVDLLYMNSDNIDQSGYITDARLGLYGELAGERSYELLILLNEIDMTHYVTYTDWVWDEVNGSARVSRMEKNLDHTITWGFHGRYVKPLNTNGVRLGGIVTMNKKSHPKIPNYEIMNIPRDPGNTLAYNIGVGLSRIDDKAAFGIDLIYEPIWSNTWANSDTAMETVSGKTLPAGGKTVINNFEFANWLIRLGLSQENNLYGMQLGLVMHSFRYDLNQQNIIDESHRRQDEHWIEWSPSWGITFKFPEFHLRYTGRTTSGTGRPGVEQQNWWWGDDISTFDTAVWAGGDFIIAPSGDLTLQETRVTTHQISVSIPLD